MTSDTQGGGFQVRSSLGPLGPCLKYKVSLVIRTDLYLQGASLTNNLEGDFEVSGVGVLVRCSMNLWGRIVSTGGNSHLDYICIFIY